MGNNINNYSGVPYGTAPKATSLKQIISSAEQYHRQKELKALEKNPAKNTTEARAKIEAKVDFKVTEEELMTYLNDQAAINKDLTGHEFFTWGKYPDGNGSLEEQKSHFKYAAEKLIPIFVLNIG